MAFLEENCVLDILTNGILTECHPFLCGDDDSESGGQDAENVVAEKCRNNNPQSGEKDAESIFIT
ncbi:MAG: hypothetical protein IKI19_08300 [Prevotella sp.]|nr:hypothetical protein [Prevotella sp.]